MKAILIDVLNLANRAAYTTGGLCRPDGTPTGVIFGLLRDVLEMERLYGTYTLAFCFDSKESLRRDLYPAYKAQRVEVRNTESDEKKVTYMRNPNFIISSKMAAIVAPIAA